MVLEKLVTIRVALRNPLWMLVVGGVVSVISLTTAFLLFQSSVGLFMTFLVTFAMSPFMMNLVSYEESREERLMKRYGEMNFLQRHKEVLSVYSAFFAGMILSLSIIFVLLPQPIVQKLFEDQIREINLIRGSATVFNTYQRIFLNNVSVLFVSFLFSFLFGAGAIFILSWNASVLSAAVGITAQAIGGVKGLPIALLTFFPHGSLEILAYFIGGLAGGLISASITKRKSMGLKIIVKDVSMLMLTSVLLLVAAAFIEVVSITFSR